MRCFYHKSDLDGHCSGAIVKKMYPDCEMIGVDYSDFVNFETIEEGEKVFVLDFCFSVEDMTRLNKMASLVWVDHHKSSIEMMAGHESILGLRKVGKAGCELTWEYLYDTEMPIAVHLLGRHDVWDHEDGRVLPFQYGMRGLKTLPLDNSLWKAALSLDNIFINKIIDQGRAILTYQRKLDATYAKGMAYEAEFEGYRAIVMNKPYTNSKAFDAVYDPEKHDIMVLFGVKPKEFKYTLFSDKPDVDVSEIAKKYGGGGHMGAAGFYSETQVV